MTRITLEIDDKVLEGMTRGCYIAHACGNDFGILFNVVVKIACGCHEGKEVIQLKYKDEARQERGEVKE